MKKLQIARIGYNVISAIFFFAALLCLLFPRTSPLAVCLFSGVLLVAYGIIKIVGYFSEDLFCLSAPVIKCKKRPRKKCSFVAEVKGKR